MCDLPIPDTPKKWDRTQPSVSDFTQCIFSMHPNCSTDWHFISSSQFNNIPFNTHTHITYQLVGWWIFKLFTCWQLQKMLWTSFFGKILCGRMALLLLRWDFWIRLHSRAATPFYMSSCVMVQFLLIFTNTYSLLGFHLVILEDVTWYLTVLWFTLHDR